MLNCKEVSKLVSESLDHKLPLWKRVNLWMHLCMCKFCWRFRKDLNHLHEETGQLASEMEPHVVEPDVRLSAKSRDRIKRMLASRES